MRRTRPDADGVIVVQAEELDRIELRTGGTPAASCLRTAVLRRCRSVRTSTPTTGVFTWLPGPGFVGAYDFLFDDQRVRILLVPKESGR